MWEINFVEDISEIVMRNLFMDDSSLPVTQHELKLQKYSKMIIKQNL